MVFLSFWKAMENPFCHKHIVNLFKDKIVLFIIISKVVSIIWIAS